MNFENLAKEYVSKYESYKAERAKIENRIEQRKRQIARLEKKLTKNYSTHPSWIDELLKPIADAMLKKISGRYYEILGPFGMTSETSIHFYKLSVPQEKLFDGDNCKSLTVRPIGLDTGHIELVDHTQNSHQYANGTMGELNGMNYPTIPMKKSINELLVFMNKQRAAQAPKTHGS